MRRILRPADAKGPWHPIGAPASLPAKEVFRVSFRRDGNPYLKRAKMLLLHRDQLSQHGAKMLLVHCVDAVAPVPRLPVQIRPLVEAAPGSSKLTLFFAGTALAFPFAGAPNLKRSQF